MLFDQTLNLKVWLVKPINMTHWLEINPGTHNFSIVKFLFKVVLTKFLKMINMCIEKVLKADMYEVKKTFCQRQQQTQFWFWAFVFGMYL